ncbi:MAG: hypothetical protein AAFR75_01075 [Pseudomonadota bacterium]
MLIIFDTCTKPDYYRDVHIVLASPAGAIVRYDYERRLWTDEAQKTMESMSADSAPVPALLMYGQVKDFKKGDSDPSFMLTKENAIFIPTRFAKIVNFSIEKKPESERDNLYLHLQLEGFVSPENPEIPKLVSALEARKELPFDRDNAYKWISECPSEIDKDTLSQHEDLNWSRVIDKFARPPSQFEGDVFWRFNDFKMTSAPDENNVLTMRARQTNKFGKIDQYHHDFELDDSNEYEFSVSNHVPVAEESDLPPNVVVSVREDASNLLSLHDEGVELRRNAATDPVKVGVSHINFLNKRYARIVVETQVPEHASPYPPGSHLNNVTVSLSKSRHRVVWTIVAACAAAPFALVAATLIRNDNTVAGIVLAVLALVLTWSATWLWTGEVNPLRKS